MDEILERITGLESGVAEILQRLNDPTRDRVWYGVNEAAKILGKDVYTVREWCREARIHAEKMPERRGKAEKWRIHRDEIARYRDDGLLPLRK